jgi:pimeloyl-ACP methyl ester carboxylesterase
MAFAEINETTLFYEDTGSGSTGETIVFSHGLLWGTELFAPQIAALRDRYRCIAWDHRGQGQSAADWRNCIDMELLAQDASALLDHLGVKRACFVGLSMGGFVGMRVAARRPDLVSRLVLIETSIEREPAENVSRYRLLNTIFRRLGPRLVAGRVGKVMLGKTVLGDPDRKAEVDGWIKLMTRRRDVWRAVNGVIDRAPMAADELAKISVPTLVVVGDEDLATPRAKAERMTAAIAGARLEIVPRAGHSSTVEQPASVNRIIEAFLAS